MTDNAKSVIEYHERTKHHPNRYARSPGFLDWANEPDPFRRYEGASLTHLPFIEKDQEANYSSLYERQEKARPFSFGNVAAFLELSVGLSAWKSLGKSSWALRINPSSGNLHPTEAHLVLPALPDLGGQGGVYHYSPLVHGLEQRAAFNESFWSRIRQHFGTEGFLVGLSSIYWREAWKYGERAFRYCNHDAGHAAACLSFSGNLLGWKTTCLNALSDREIETVLGFDKVKWKRLERENPEFLLFVHKPGKDAPVSLPSGVIESFGSLSFTGEPNLLSEVHMDWHVLDDVSLATAKPATPGRSYDYGETGFLEKEVPSISAAKIIRQRRSALDYDRNASLARGAFFAVLDKTLPRNRCAPFDAGLSETSVHLLLFVHRISGLDPGLYFLIRDRGDMERLKRKCDPGFAWEKAEGAPESLPLYLLENGDFSRRAEAASCHQEIAGDGVFSLAMIAKFREKTESHPFLYRHLHWETGMIGQVLYLEAEAQGMRGTGMGCFFDDPVHELLGLKDNTYQDLYHFAVGKAVEDKRLTTLPPYHHLKGKR